MPSIPEFYLVDTPGFDDTTRSDADILREVASWLAKAYSSNLKLTGIIYLHRIMDVRLGGSGMKNLRMFKKLCGEDSLESVVLATTFWGNVEEKEGIMRETQLKAKTEFWGGLIAKGSAVFRQNNGRESAEEIVKYLVQRRHKVVLDIQKELIDGKKTLDDTAAGGELQVELNKAKAAYEEKLKQVRDEMKQALGQQDKAWQAEIQRTKDHFEAKMREDEESREKLRVQQEELWRQRETERQEEKRQWLEEKVESQQQVAQFEYEIQRIRSDGEKETLRHQLEIERQRVRYFEEKEDSCVVM